MKTDHRNSLVQTVLLAFLLVAATMLLPGSVDARECSGSKAPCSLAADCPSGETCDAVIGDYCVQPPFITAGVKPNMLLLMDNSASMYDLAYVDKGKKRCSATTTKSCSIDYDCSYCSIDTAKKCTSNLECAGGETCNTAELCSIVDREPYYCYDETYASSNDYYGYFDKDKFYSYRKGSDDFAEQPSGYTYSCATGAYTTKSIANTMCLQFNLPDVLVGFVAKGNYLNWLTASKIDVQKKILTGGKFDGSAMIPESRGCVGQGYVKDVNTADFTNYGEDETNTNVPLGVTFTVTGEPNPSNPTAPSTGGQTYINVYSANGKEFNFAACQEAIQAIAIANNPATIKTTVDACLDSTGTISGSCRLATPPLPAKSCATNSDCYVNMPANTAAPYICKANTVQSCSGSSDVTSCVVPARNSCSGKASIACTALTEATACKPITPAVNGHCSTDKAKYTPLPGKNDVPPSGVLCTTPTETTDCRFRSSGKDFTGTAGVCVGYVAPVQQDFTPCVVTAAADFGPCISNYVGDCITSGQQAVVKTKVAFQQSMQECWTIRGETHTAADGYGLANVATILQMCPDIYANFRTCSDDRGTQCPAPAATTGTAFCAAQGKGVCDSGPAAIVAGNPGYLCGIGYAGDYYEMNSAGNWELKAEVTKPDYIQLKEAEYRFCNNMSAPPVTDPSDGPSNTPVTDNLPAILSGLGVESQLGSPLITMKARVVKSAAAADLKEGLVQRFGGNIRLGAMSFNPFGSAAETALLGTPKACPDGTVCTRDADCPRDGSGGIVVASCSATGATNLDGSRILYPIGLGKCSTMTSTPCKLDTDCSGSNTCLEGYCGDKGSTVCTTVANCTSGSNQACIGDSVGGHTTSASLVKVLDDVRASSWTPFAEAYYNAIGYFARIPDGETNAGKSRTALRLNTISETSTDYTSFSTAPKDFNENYNPSEFRCQQNYVLMITDGSSTADRNSTVNSLATLYAAPAGITQTTCTGAAPQPAGYTGPTLDYGGNNNLPIMAWLAKNRNISNFSTTSPASTVLPSTARDSITSYVVFNGESNGASGDCNSFTLLKKTAEKGGSAVRQANNYPALVDALTAVFQDVAARAASGTAASILSNSEGSGANILQAVFFPKKIFEDQTTVKWIGEMQNLWYFVDPYINNSTIREDTDSDFKLNLVNDYVARFSFDNTADKTMVQRYQDTDGDGTGDVAYGSLIDPDYVKSLWRAGKLLWARNLTTSPRNLYTSLNATDPAAPPSLLNFSTANAATLAPYLNLTVAAAPSMISWVHGVDQAGYRNRTVKIKDPVTNVMSNGVWRLGDIISSTPRVQSTVSLNTYNLPPPGGYNDKSYQSFIGSNQYQERGMVYVGGNDGMFHAFNLGVLSVKALGAQKASLSGSDLGKEMWAYIPKNSLPYLQYLADPDYNHIYYIDGRTILFDASIGYTGIDGCVRDNYADCAKPTNSMVTVSDSNKNIDPAKNTWRTVVIGGMGLGGASKLTCAVGADCVQTPIADPADATKGLGYSSYFALDVTDPVTPSLLWEFASPDLGYSMSGPAIVRLGDRQKNGKWFAVFGSGPTGPIDSDSRQFLGRSNQNLKFFIVDLQTGVLVRTIDTGIAEAFAASMVGGSIDIDRKSTVTGSYQDDAIYVGFTRKCTATDSGCVTGTWTKGGVGRIMTMESLNPNDASKPWAWSFVLNDIGPVTTAISRLQDTKNKNLWLYFGSGRYFYRDSSALDDNDGVRKLYGIKEPCYNTVTTPGNFLDKTCTATASSSDLKDQTGSISTVAAENDGWFITLDGATVKGVSGATVTQAAERVVTDTVALTNGSVFFTSFKPTMDICGYGGNSYLWAAKYDTGGQAASNALTGKALIQLSTGEFKEIDLAVAFTDKLNRRMATPMTGKPPSDAPPIISSSQNKPVKKILHIQEH